MLRLRKVKGMKEFAYLINIVDFERSHLTQNSRHAKLKEAASEGQKKVLAKSS